MINHFVYRKHPTDGSLDLVKDIQDNLQQNHTALNMLIEEHNLCVKANLGDYLSEPHPDVVAELRREKDPNV